MIMQVLYQLSRGSVAASEAFCCPLTERTLRTKVPQLRVKFSELQQPVLELQILEITVIFASVECHLSVGFICISLMTDGVEHLLCV